MEIASENSTLEEIGTAQQCAPMKEGFVRFQAIELLLDGYEKEEVAGICHCSIRTIERWIAAFNARGIDGLAIKGRSGRPRRIPKEKFSEEIIPLVLDPSKAEESYWSAVKLHGYLIKELHYELSYSTLLSYLHEHDMKLLVPRKWATRQDQEKRKEFLDKISKLNKDSSRELWFGDEAGIEGDPRPRRIWVKKGSRPKTPYLGDHIRTNVIGAVCPASGDFFSLVVPHSDKEVFQVFLNQLAAHTKGKEKKIVLVVDNASWHRSESLNWHHIEPCFLPPYSPDLNPIEIVWRCLKERFFNNWYAKTSDELIERTCLGLRSLIQNPNEISSITSFLL